MAPPGKPGSRRPLRLLLTMAAMAAVATALFKLRAPRQPSCSSGPYSSSAGPSMKQRVPDINLAMQLPSWASCPDRVCNYTQLDEGPIRDSVARKSTFGEDEWLYHNLFYHRRGGFYLEMGAMEGLGSSHSYWFSRAAGWKGMLIEGCPTMYKNLEQNRPDAINVHAAVCADFRTVHWLSAGNVGGIVEFMADGFKEKWHPELNVEELPQVPCVPLSYILDRFGIDSIDLWALDVEGAELQVLQSVDLSRIKVKVIVAELDGHNRKKDRQVTKLLEKAGFEAIRKTLDNDMNKYNTVFVHKDAWPLLHHAPNISEVHLRRR